MLEQPSISIYNSSSAAHQEESPRPQHLTTDAEAPAGYVCLTFARSESSNTAQHSDPRAVKLASSKPIRVPIGEPEDAEGAEQQTEAPFTIELSPTPPSRESLSPRLLNMSLSQEQEEGPAQDSSAHEKLAVTVPIAGPISVPIPGLVDSELSPADVPSQVGRLQTLVSKSSAKITALSHRVGGVEQQLLEQHRLIERLEATQVDAIVELHAIREMVNQTNSRMRYISEDMRIVKAQSVGEHQLDTFESVLRKQSQALESAGGPFDAPGPGPASDVPDALSLDAGGSAYRPNRVQSLTGADSSAVRDLESKVSGLRLDVFAWQSEQQSEQARLADELRGTIGSLVELQRAQREQGDRLLAEVRELTKNVRGEMDEIRTEMGTIRESVLIIEQREPISKEVCVMAQNLVAGLPHTHIED